MKFLLSALILVGTLALFNPNEEDFADYINDTDHLAAADIARQDSGGLLGVARTERDVLVEESLIRNVERKNYLVLSTYALYGNGADTGRTWHFLGIGSQFFVVNSPDSRVR